MQDMREDVLDVLLESEEPLYLAEIANKLGETSQLVQYHLNQLVSEGILLTYSQDRKRYYSLQQVQYKYPPEKLYEILMPLAQDMAEFITCEQTEETPSRVLANNLILLLERFTTDIDDIFEETNDEDIF